MTTPVKAAFAYDGITLPLDALLPIRSVKHSDHAFGKFRAIFASIKEVGVIEPLVVHPQRGITGMYVLLDGHLRLRALRELEKTEVFCILATTDDAFSYNHQVNRISIIQEHRMILRAIERGVTPEQIAKALAVDIDKIVAGMNLLDGIHPDAVELLKDKPISSFALQLLRKAKPVRQIDMAQLMVSGNNFTRAYAEALIIGTPPDQLVRGLKTKTKGLTAEELARLESEMEVLERDFRLSQDGFGENSLHLNGTQRYVKRLLDNPKIKRFLGMRYPELLEEFEDLVALQSLG
jgi:ParB-like chromosome segregation protein Spo0J